MSESNGKDRNILDEAEGNESWRNKKKSTFIEKEN